MNNRSTGNLRTREIGLADSVGRIEPHGDKNETDKICGGGNPRRAPLLSEQTIKPWRPAELACALDPRRPSRNTAVTQETGRRNSVERLDPGAEIKGQPATETRQPRRHKTGTGNTPY
jgi:hypothetical protein